MQFGSDTKSYHRNIAFSSSFESRTLQLKHNITIEENIKIGKLLKITNIDNEETSKHKILS